MKHLHINIFVLIFLIVADNASTTTRYLRGIHYPVDHEHSRDCQSAHTGLQGVCKSFSECHSAQKSWFSLRIYPTICHYNRFESVVCCWDEAPITSFPSPSIFKQPISNNGGVFNAGGFQGNNGRPIANNQFPNSPAEISGPSIDNGNNRIVTPQFPINTGNNQGHFPSTNNQFPVLGSAQQNFPSSNNQFPIFATGQQNRPNSNNQFPSNQGNAQGNFPNQNTQFPVFQSGQQNRPDTNNQFPINPGNIQGNFPNQNTQLPVFGSGQQNGPNTNNQFPINTGSNQGSFPNQNTQLPVFQSGQQNRPDTNNQFPLNPGNNQGSFPNQNTQLPVFQSGQQNRPDTNNQFPINQGNFPSTNNQFPIFGNQQPNRPPGNNQFSNSGIGQQIPPSTSNPTNQANNQGSSQNANNQFPVAGQVNSPDISDCTVLIIADENNPIGSRCVVPDPRDQNQNNQNQNNQDQNTQNQFGSNPTNQNQNNQNQNNQDQNTQNQFASNPTNQNQINQNQINRDQYIQDHFGPDPIDENQNNQNQNNQNQNTQNQFGQINAQNRQPTSSSTGFQQDQPLNQAPNESEEEEYKPPRLSQDRCEAVYDVTSLVGGEPTEIGQYPFMAAIGWKRFDDKLEFNCGGFLVSRNFVLTAAHCAILGGDKPFAVRTGGINLDNETSSDLDIPIEEIIVHPNYQDNQTYNDIALMRLSKRANDEFACIWQTNKIDKEYEEVKAIGYGHTTFGGPRSNSLLQIKLKLFDNKQCSPYYQPESRFPKGVIDSQICSGDLTRAKDTCQGDSGGPIFITRTSTVGTLTPIVIGITSFGQGCAGEAPSLYTRLSSFLDWIEPIVWPNF